MTEFYVGQTLYSRPKGSSSYQRATITRIGRSYVYAVLDGYSLEFAIVKEHRHRKEWPHEKFYFSIEAHERELQLRKSWDKLRRAVDNTFSVPAHLTPEDIAAIYEKIFQKPCSTDSSD